MNFKPSFGSILLVIASLVLGIILSFTYTTMSLSNYSHQICSQLLAIATARGKMTSYNIAIKDAYRQLYKIRCG